MIIGKLVALSEIYTCEVEGCKYNITFSWSCNEDEGEKTDITIYKDTPDSYDYEILSEEGLWVDEECSNSMNFNSVEEAIGYLNNAHSDDIKIGECVDIDISKRGIEQKYKGTVVANDKYNDDYPYRVRMDDGSIGYFSTTEVTHEN